MQHIQPEQAQTQPKDPDHKVKGTPDPDLHQESNTIKDQEEEMKNSEKNKTDQEDNNEMELEGLDLQSIVAACARQEVHSIPENQIQLLKSTFLKSKHKDKAGSTQKGKHSRTSSLGIKNQSSKEITKATKVDKKRGRPSNKQPLQELGELLVNSGRNRSMAEKFSSQTPHSQ